MTMKKNSSWKVRSSMGVMASTTSPGGSPLCRRAIGLPLSHDVGPQLEAVELLFLAQLHHLVDQGVVGALVGADDDRRAAVAVVVLLGVSGALVQPILEVGDGRQVIQVPGLLTENAEQVAAGVDVEEQDVALALLDG